MPIIRKISKSGKRSRVVTLPATWIENIEQTTGKKVVAVAMEINGKITITPVLEK